LTKKNEESAKLGTLDTWYYRFFHIFWGIKSTGGTVNREIVWQKN